MQAKNAKQEQPEEPPPDHPALNEELVYQKRGNVQLEDEEQEAAQPQEHELGQEPDPAHAEPEAAKPAELEAEADQELGAEQAEADAGRE